MYYSLIGIISNTESEQIAATSWQLKSTITISPPCTYLVIGQCIKDPTTYAKYQDAIRKHVAIITIQQFLQHIQTTPSAAPPVASPSAEPLAASPSAIPSAASPSAEPLLAISSSKIPDLDQATPLIGSIVAKKRSIHRKVSVAIPDIKTIEADAKIYTEDNNVAKVKAESKKVVVKAEGKKVVAKVKAESKLVKAESKKDKKVEEVVDVDEKVGGGGEVEDVDVKVVVVPQRQFFFPLEKRVVEIPVDHQLFTQRYAPSSSDDMAGNPGEIAKFRTWLSQWDAIYRYKTQSYVFHHDNLYAKVALISGPVGVGKTTLAHLMAKELGFNLVRESNASQSRSETELMTEFATFVSNLLPYEHKILILDEIDTIGQYDFHGMQGIRQLIKISQIPIILIVNDRSADHIRPFTKTCIEIKLRALTDQQIQSYLIRNKVPHSSNIMEYANGDLRSILMMCQFGIGSDADTIPSNSFEATRILCDPNVSMDRRENAWLQDTFMNTSFYEEQIRHLDRKQKSTQLADLENMADAYDDLSIADQLMTRATGYEGAIMGLQGHRFRQSPGQIQFPGSLGKMSTRTKCMGQLQQYGRRYRVATQLMRLDYVPVIYDAMWQCRMNPTILIPRLKQLQMELVDFQESIGSMMLGKPGMMEDMTPGQKAAITRTYNKYHK